MAKDYTGPSLEMVEDLLERPAKFLKDLDRGSETYGDLEGKMITATRGVVLAHIKRVLDDVPLEGRDGPDYTRAKLWHYLAGHKECGFWGLETDMAEGAIAIKAINKRNSSTGLQPLSTDFEIDDSLALGAICRDNGPAVSKMLASGGMGSPKLLVLPEGLTMKHLLRSLQDANPIGVAPTISKYYPLDEPLTRTRVALVDDVGTWCSDLSYKAPDGVVGSNNIDALTFAMLAVSVHDYYKAMRLQDHRPHWGKAFSVVLSDKMDGNKIGYVDYRDSNRKGSRYYFGARSDIGTRGRPWCTLPMFSGEL